MTSSLERIKLPEEQELTRYFAVIETKKRHVAEAQAELEALRDALARFNAEYHARVSVWLVEVNRLEREAEEYRRKSQLTREEPYADTEEIFRRVETEFRRQRQRQEEEEQRSRQFREQAKAYQEQPTLDDDQEARLRRLFRELAKRFHPDLATSDDERAERTRRMQAVSDAFHRRDVDALERLALSDDIGSITFDYLSIAEKLVWAIREVSRLDQLLQSLGHELEQLSHSAMFRLLQEQRAGKEPLVQLEAEAKRKRLLAQAKLDDAKKEYERAV